MRIGLDLDGVTVDFDRGWVQQYNRQFSPGADLFAVRKYARWHAFNQFAHFNDTREFWQWAMDVPAFWFSMPPVDGAVGSIQFLQREGHEFVVITHRWPSAEGETRAWLIAHGLQIEEQHYGVDKGSVDVDLWIDDGPHVLTELHEAGKHAVKFERAYNLRHPATASVRDWSEFVAYLDSLS